jgi:predicted RNA binding protein YcfA (HicA-like mRNA interferase family)
MGRLPILSGREIAAALGKLGYHLSRQRGSHMRLSCPGRESVTVPDHKAIDRHLLMKILRDAELTAEDFSRLL